MEQWTTDSSRSGGLALQLPVVSAAGIVRCRALTALPRLTLVTAGATDRVSEHTSIMGVRVFIVSFLGITAAAASWAPAHRKLGSILPRPRVPPCPGSLVLLARAPPQPKPCHLSLHPSQLHAVRRRHARRRLPQAPAAAQRARPAAAAAKH